MYCNKCGQEIDERDLYCPYCSSKVDNESIESIMASKEEDDASEDTFDADILIDISTKLKNSENKNVDEEYEQYKQSIFNNTNQSNDHFDFEEYEEDDGFKGIGNKLLIVLIVIAFVTATALAAKYFFFDDNLSTPPEEGPIEIEEEQNGEDITQTPSDNNEEEDLTSREQIFNKLDTLNYNIQEIQNNEALKYDENIEYKTEDINSSTPVSNQVWKEIEGKTYYYDEVIIKSLVQFNSKWIDYVNNNDKTVLSLVEKDSKAYKNVVTFNRDGTLEEFLLFEIGEIRKGNDGYYVWTHEKIKVVKDGESEIREYNWIYQLVEGEYDFFISNYHRY